MFAVLEKGYAMYGDQTPNPFPSSIALKVSPHVPQITPITPPLPSKNQSFSIPPTPTPLPRNNPYRYAGLLSDPQTRICTYLIDVRNKVFFSLAFLIWRALILDRICRTTPPLPGLDAGFLENSLGESKAAIAEWKYTVWVGGLFQVLICRKRR